MSRVVCPYCYRRFSITIHFLPQNISTGSVPSTLQYRATASLLYRHLEMLFLVSEELSMPLSWYVLPTACSTEEEKTNPDPLSNPKHYLISAPLCHPIQKMKTQVRSYWRVSPNSIHSLFRSKMVCPLDASVSLSLWTMDSGASTILLALASGVWGTFVFRQILYSTDRWLKPFFPLSKKK